jgi:hypothetical protein
MAAAAGAALRVPAHECHSKSRAPSVPNRRTTKKCKIIFLHFFSSDKFDVFKEEFRSALLLKMANFIPVSRSLRRTRSAVTKLEDPVEFIKRLPLKKLWKDDLNLPLLLNR